MQIFGFILVFSLELYGIKTIILKPLASISRYILGNKYKLDIPGVAKTHMMPTQNGSGADNRKTPPCAEKQFYKPSKAS